MPVAPGIIIADLHIGILFALSVGSLAVFPVWMAGWASNNKYALLGGMRSAAQSISYEIPLLLSATVPIILADSFRVTDIVTAQLGGNWFAFWPPGPGLAAFALFFLCSLAEANRIPFDIPEAESELVSGVSTEYTGMKFGLFARRYLHTFISSSPLPSSSGLGWPRENDGLIWMMGPRHSSPASSGFDGRTAYRSDQLMAIC